MKKILFVLSFSLVGAIVPVHAELPTKVRDNLSDIIKDYCHSSVTYSINDFIGTWDTENNTWAEDEGKAQEFHKTVGCIFDSALKELTEKEKLVAEKSFDTGSLPIKTFSLEAECSGLESLESIQLTQEANGFDSKCQEGKKIKEISQFYSACRIAETVLQEWCGYDLFLYTKMQDEESFYESQKSVVSHNELAARFRAEKKKMEEERERVERTVFATINWYQQAETAMTQDAWLVAIQSQLEKINKQWATMRSALGTFVDKFLNASIPPTS